MAATRLTRAACASGFVILILLSWGVLGAAPVGRAASQPVCTDVGQTPVLKDTHWTHMGTGPGYNDYATKYDGIFVMKQGSQFVAYIRIDTNGSNSGIYRGVSKDGVDWNITKRPVLSTGPPGTWDSTLVFYPDVVWNGTGYMMYYDGDGVYNSTTFPANFRQIGVAFSMDGVSWTKYSGNPVITHGPGVYDARFTRVPSVLYEGGTYKMWYFGTPSLGSATDYVSNIDYATSADGVHWTKYAGNPVFTGFSESGTLVAHSPSVMKVNGTYLMAFSDGSSNIGYALSADGVNWRFNNATNVLEGLSGWHNGYVDFPSMLLEGNRLFLWFFGTDNSNETLPYSAGIGFATCGLALVPEPVTTVTTTTSTATTTVRTISTTISTSTSTSTMRLTEASTLIENQSAGVIQLITAAVVGFAAAVALAVVLIATRLRLRSRT